AKPAADERPSYHVGDKWTPTAEQIADARKRQQQRRLGNPWRRLPPGPEFEAARTSILCATDIPQEDPKANQRCRTIRALAFDPAAEIFARNLRVSPDRYLIEFRHPRLTRNAGQIPVGLRFIGLSINAWKKADQVGLYLDGRPLIPILFKPDLEATIKDADLAESYIRFRLDHELSHDLQLYLVSDKDDFLLAEEGAPAEGEPLATAQFRMAAAATDSVPGETALASALKISNDALIPPTFISPQKNNGSHALIFTTFIARLQLYHMCWEIRLDCNIIPVGESHRQRTPEDKTLPLVPVRSFNEQVSALNRVHDD